MTVSTALANLFTIIEAIAVIVSVLFIAYQVWLGNKLTRAANMQSTFEMASPFNLELIKDKEVAALWMDGAKRYGKVSPLYDERFTNLLVYWLLLHENIYYQYQQGLLHSEAYAAWERDLVHFLQEQKVGRYWQGMRKNFQSSFGDHVLELMMRDTPDELPDSVKNAANAKPR